MVDGTIHDSINYGKFRIIKYSNALNVEVEFLETGYNSTLHSTDIRRGQAKDYIRPSTNGVGFLGYGKHKTRENKKMTKEHADWLNMLKRCYCEKFQAKYPSYKGVTVCKDWHNFQNFAEWHKVNHVTGYHLDKDIKQQGIIDKIYSPETCCFVSAAKNAEEALAKHYEFKNPDGEIINVYNLKKFSLKNNLTPCTMSVVNNGRIINHKGWTKA